MRIVGGTLGGRRFNPPAKNWPTRPTTDYAKEGLFNILQNRIDFEETKMLDIFGGTGSHCFEAISRGCKDVTYVDKYRPATIFVKKTASELEIEEHLTIILRDVARYVKQTKQQFDYIFAGPPYPLPWLDTIPELIFKHELLKPDGLFVLEHNPNHDFSEDPRFTELKTYGTTQFSFFRWEDVDRP